MKYMTDEEELAAIKVAVPKALNEAAAIAMEMNGKVLEAKDGWLVWTYADGTVERVRKLGV